MEINSLASSFVSRSLEVGEKFSVPFDIMLPFQNSSYTRFQTRNLRNFPTSISVMVQNGLVL